MAVLQAILAALTRSAGRLLNTVFGWATLMLFGKVPQSRQIYLSGMAFGSVAWIALVAGIAFPRVGTFLLAFVPLPKWVNPGWVRLTMLAGALVLPALIGGLSLLLHDPAERPKGWRARAMAVLKGYPFTFGLSLTLAMLIVFAPIMKARALLRRWSTQHVPMLVEPDAYEAVLGGIRDALAARGWETTRQPASWMVRVPTRVLTWFAGGAVSNLVADRLAMLGAPGLEVLLHPSDLVISGPAVDVARARATLAERLAFSRAHLTWTKEANEVEDGLRQLWHELEAPDDRGARRAAGRIRRLTRDLETLELAYEEWEVLFRQQLLLELRAAEAVSGTLGHRDAANGSSPLSRASALAGALLLALGSRAAASAHGRDVLTRVALRVVDAARATLAGKRPGAPTR